jgi:hypothetical protein
MKSPARMPTLLAAAILAAAATPAIAQAKERALDCYVVVEEGSSSEGNSLFLQKMGVDPEALKSFAPTSFSRVGKKFSASVQGTFAYEADSPVLVERRGRIALYEVAVRLRSDPLPSPAKKVSVTLLIGDLAESGDLVQPALRAMDLAAASLKWTSGTAWIIDMRPAGAGKLKAIVGLAKQP